MRAAVPTVLFPPSVQQPVQMSSGPEPDAMRIAVLVLLFVAISGGSVLATMHRRGRVPPWYIVLAHGSLGLAALVTLVVEIYVGRGPVTTASILTILCLAVTVLAAFTMFALRLMRKKAPGPLIAVHAGFAVLAFVVLLVATLGAAG